MSSTFAVSLTKWSLDLATKLIKADVRLHNVEAIEDDMAIMFVVNHFTRLETMLLPYVIYKHTGKEVWSLAAADLFSGRIGEYLRSMGTVSTQDPDRDRIIVRTLLSGEHPWMIFPEGQMIKDKKVVDHRGQFQVFNEGVRRPPHTGAAVLALRAEFYRHKIACLQERPDQEELAAALALFNLTSADEVLAKRTVIIPVNITYYPIRAHDNLLLRMASRFAQDLSKRAVEELSVEGTVISEDTDIDITLGEPICVKEYLNDPEYAELMACGLNDMHSLEDDSASHFNVAARKLMLRYMARIYELTTINYDHIFATLIRYQQEQSFTERAFRDRVFLAARAIVGLQHHRLHTVLEKTYNDIVFEDPSPKFHDFLALCLREKVLVREGNLYHRTHHLKRAEVGFHSVRFEELTEVIANEVEPLSDVTEAIRKVARMPGLLLSNAIHDHFVHEDMRRFESDYAKFYDPAYSKGPEVGRPFLLKPLNVKAGIVLAHGYLAAPYEVRRLAEYFFKRGYAVYGVRLAGHGTSPADLAQISWSDWYDSFNRGYAVMKSLTENIIVGGFSTGGCMALIAAARKGFKVQSCFSISAPLQLKNYGIRLAPSIVTLNSMLKRIGRSRADWEYVDNEPENRHINYFRNPLTGVRELVAVMDEMERVLPDIQVPTIIVQGSKDTVVNAVSAQMIFDKLGTRHKEMTLFERDRHGILNGEGREDIFERICSFLERAPAHATVLTESSEAVPAPKPTPELVPRAEQLIPQEST